MCKTEKETKEHFEGRCQRLEKFWGKISRGYFSGRLGPDLKRFPSPWFPLRDLPTPENAAELSRIWMIGKVEADFPITQLECVAKLHYTWNKERNRINRSEATTEINETKIAWEWKESMDTTRKAKERRRIERQKRKERRNRQT